MKKTVFILTMLLGTVVAFGQTAKQLQDKSISFGEQRVTEKEMKKSNDFNSSIKHGNPLFTKNTLFQTQFESVDEVTFGTMPNHNIAAGKGEWVWVQDSSRNSFQTTTQGVPEVTYNKLVTYNWLTNNNPTRYKTFNSPSISNGFIGIFPVDNSGGVSGTFYNAYVELAQTVNTSEVEAIDITFYQRTMRFNSDHYYIEWSSDNGTTWDSLEVNVKFIDMDVNDQYYAYKTVGLPDGTGGHDNLRIRFRYTTTWDAARPNITGGYVWMIDDLTITETPEQRAETTAESYYEGAFHNIPYGLNMVNIDWYTLVKNTGTDDLTSVQASIVIPENPSTEGKSDPIATLTYLRQDTLFINDYDGRTTTNIALPSNLEDAYHVSSKVSFSNYDSIIQGPNYTVKSNGFGEHNKRVWSRDNGVLVSGARYAAGVIEEGVWTDDDTGISTAEGYTVCLAFPLAANVGAEYPDGVWLNGINFISSTESAPGSPIFLFATQDSSETFSLRFEVAGKDEPYIVSNSDISVLEEGTYSNNPTSVFVPFDVPYKMKTNEVYRACYQIADVETNFWLGKDNVGISGETLPPGFGFGRTFNLIVATSYLGATLPSPNTPMIRLAVGPKSLGIAGRPVEKPSFKLNNFPNPAKEKTTIKYTLPESANVTIEIRDLMGRIVRSIAQGTQADGDYSYELTTSGMANGTYFYSLIVNGSVQTKKMVVNK